MNDQQTIEKLEGLRGRVLDDIMSMADKIVGNGEADLEVLLTISRNTGNVELLVKAFEKCQTIDDSAGKTEALITILGEIEERIADIQMDSNYAVDVPDQPQMGEQANQDEQANG